MRVPKCRHLAFALASVALAGCQSDLVAPTTPTAPAASVASMGPTFARGAGDVIPGQYLVLLRGDRVARGSDVATLASTKLARLAHGRGTLRLAYRHAVAGFSAQLTDSAVAALRADPDVAVVEPDPVVTVSGTQTSAPWGLDRIDQAQLPLDGNYTYATSGAGVTVYIVDTGILLEHTQFGGRAVTGRDFVTTGGTASDCHGHGTHVAGTVGGSTYGVAKSARLVAVRVLDCSGNGSGSNIIGALDWVVQQKQGSPSTPMVVNMSLGGGAAASIDAAVQNAVAAGVTVVVAAGNSSADACGASPARAPNAITVGAISWYADNWASFSNYGACVDLSAPGVGITSAGISSPTATADMSGTSMATPHVAGAAALYLSANPSATPAQVTAALVNNASPDVIVGAPSGTPNKLLNVAFLAATVPTTTTTTVLANTAAGTCLAVQGGTRANVVPLTLAACSGTAAEQQWTMGTVGNASLMKVFGGAYCADDWGARGAVGDQVGTYTCVPGAPTQTWTLTSAGELRGVNNLCVGTAASGGATTIALQTCTGAASQKWTAGVPTTTPTPARFTATLASGTSGLCMSVGGTAKSLARAVLAACGTGAGLVWEFPPTGTGDLVKVFGGAYCLDDWYARAAVGDQLGTYGCYAGAPTQTWTLTSAGEFKLSNGLCVAVSGTVAVGAPLTLATCDGSAGQQWTATAATAATATAVASSRAAAVRTAVQGS